MACGSALALGKIAGYAGGIEREAAVYSEKNGFEHWTITGPSGNFEFSVEPGEYMVSCGGSLVPYVRVREGETTRVNRSENPSIEMQSEMWTPPGLSFGQTYTAMGTSFNGVGLWMPSGDTRLRLSLREGGPDGRLIGEVVTPEKKQWITTISMGDVRCPTEPGKVYYVELESADGTPWSIAMPKGPDVYDGGIAYFDRKPHPESDLGIGVWETRPGLVHIAAAQEDQHFIKEGPGSGSCTVAGQTFVARNGRNILAAGANCGFGGGVQDFIYTIYKGGPSGEVVTSKKTRMVSDWGTTAYFLPHEVILEPGERYYFEYKRVDGEPFYSYLSADVYPDGEAYRDGKIVEGGFDQFFEIRGEVEPGGLTFPYNIKLSDITSDSATVSWETGTPADGIVHYGDSTRLGSTAVATAGLDIEHKVTLAGLEPGTTYYYRATSYTGKETFTRMWGRMESFMTLPVGTDSPRFDRPEQPAPAAPRGPNEVPIVNGGFEEGLQGWSRCSSADPKKYEEAEKEYPIGNGPFGSATYGADGYTPHSGKMMYGWSYLGAEDPNPLLPREDWKHEIVYQRIAVTPGQRYVLKAWAITGDRGSGWGRDSRVRLVVDPADSGALESIETSGNASATQWFALENQWKPISLHFTAEKNTAVVGAHFLQWWALEACYLYVDDVRVEAVSE